MRLPVIMICLCYIILILTDLLIIYDLRTMSLYPGHRSSEKKRKIWWKVYLVFAILIFILLTVGVCLPKRSAGEGITTAMWIFYIITTVELSQLIYCIFSLLGFIPAIFRKGRWNLGLWVGFPLAAILFLAMWWGVFVGRKQIDVVNVEISSPKIPESFNDYKIAHISDLHVGTWGNDTTFISTLVDSVNALKPDLIVFTGDVVNREAEEFLPFVKSFSRLNAPDGVLSILGNHDYGDYVSWKSNQAKKDNLDSLKSYQASAGWQLLDNNHLFLTRGNDTIAVLGVGNWGEPPFTKYGDLKKAYPKDSLTDKNYKILLSHNPEHWNQEILFISNIDLTLAGHTHAMQSMISIGDWRWSPAQYRYKYWRGLHKRKNIKGEESWLYVNIGAGEVGIPMRIGAPPEVTLFTLKHSK